MAKTNTETAKPEPQSTAVIIGPARFSYLHFHEPKAAKGSTKAKYSVSLLIPKSNLELKKKIDNAIQAATVAKFGNKAPKGLKIPLRDGDAERDDTDYAGHWFINASSYDKPGMVDANRDPIIEKEKIYSGMYGRAAVNMYFSSTGGDKICCGLNNLQKLKDGPNLTGRKAAEDEFDDEYVFSDDENDDLK